MGSHSSDDSSDERNRRKRRSSPSNERSRSRDRDRKKRYEDEGKRFYDERFGSESREKTERWPKDGYRELQKDNFRRDRHRDNFHDRSSHLSEEFMANRRSQREEICERGAAEVSNAY